VAARRAAVAGAAALQPAAVAAVAVRPPLRPLGWELRRSWKPPLSMLPARRYRARNGRAQDPIEPLQASGDRRNGGRILSGS
jgi:hypothetical protein